MAYVDVKCDYCGRYLGMKGIPIIGIDPDFNGKKGDCTDPDCVDCNPHYNDNCESCGVNRINHLGICTRCNHVQSDALPLVGARDTAIVLAV